MSFAFSKIAQRRRGVVSDVQVPMSRFYGAAWEAGVHESIFASVSRISEQYLERNDTVIANLFGFDNGPMIEASDAELRAKDRGLSIKFDKPISENELSLIIDRHEKRRKRDFYLSRGEGMHNISGFGVQMAASMTNPVDFSLMFVPIVGQSKVAKGMAMAGRGPARRALARGLITQESIAARGVKHPWLVESAIEGSVGQLIVEIPYSISEVASKTDYGPTDFMVNLAAGAAFATTFRGSLEGAAHIFRKTSRKTQEVMFRRAIDNFAKGEDIDVAKFVDLDEQRLREQAVFDEVAARQQAKERIESIDEFRKQATSELTPEEKVTGIPEYAGAIVRFKGEKGIIRTDGQLLIIETPKRIYELGNIESLSDTSPSSLGVNVEDLGVQVLDDKTILVRDKLYQNLFSKKLSAISLDKDGNRVVRLDTMSKNPQPVTFRGQAAEEIAYQLQLAKDEYVSPIERKLSEEIDEIPIEKINKRAHQLRENAIERFIREERKKFDPESEYQRIRAQEIARQQAEGRVLSDEQVNRFTSKERVEDSDISAVEKDIQNLEEELEVEGKSDTATLREAKEPGPAMIEAATNCLRNNG